MNHSFQQRILVAAHKIFTDKGYRQADMRSIAKEAGIAVGTIYNYYPNKAVLYQAILAEQWDELEHRIFQVTQDAGQAPVAKLSSITDLLLVFVAHHSSFWREIVEDPQRDAEMRDEGHRAQLRAHEQLKKHLRSVFAELASSEARIERHILTYMASVANIGVFFPDQPEENRQYVTELVEHMVTDSPAGKHLAEHNGK
ncbi:TetR/AcrR family transcriptional regulator [Aneurinibacillus sp. BA2021]|nr:TetR/AcrR family transcriptional regulator [Aneurinibacillus sp. BA2021]